MEEKSCTASCPSTHEMWIRDVTSSVTRHLSGRAPPGRRPHPGAAGTQQRSVPRLLGRGWRAGGARPGSGPRGRVPAAGPGERGAGPPARPLRAASRYHGDGARCGAGPCDAATVAAAAGRITRRVWIAQWGSRGRRRRGGGPGSAAAPPAPGAASRRPPRPGCGVSMAAAAPPAASPPPPKTSWGGSGCGPRAALHGEGVGARRARWAGAGGGLGMWPRGCRSPRELFLRRLPRRVSSTSCLGMVPPAARESGNYQATSNIGRKVCWVSGQAWGRAAGRGVCVPPLGVFQPRLGKALLWAQSWSCSDRRLTPDKVPASLR